MNAYEFVIGLMILMIVASAVRAGTGGRRRRGREEAAEEIETERLREEVQTLRDRLAVLERITIEKESSLEREFDKLRDR